MAASSNTRASYSGGIGLLNLLGILFVGLKLTGFIDWSWWWVTLPFYAGLLIALALVLIGGLVLGIVKLVGR